MDNEETLETTLGDLIVALTEETTAFVRDEEEVCKVVAFALTHLLRNARAIQRAQQIWH